MIFFCVFSSSVLVPLHYGDEFVCVAVGDGAPYLYGCSSFVADLVLTIPDGCFFVNMVLNEVIVLVSVFT